MTEKFDPLHPDNEQRLFESLSMSSDDFETLEFIRQQMRYIIRDEQKFRLSSPPKTE